MKRSLKVLERIVKVGDDLRQDQLTLQLIRIMDTMWRNGQYSNPESSSFRSSSNSLSKKGSFFGKFSVFNRERSASKTTAEAEDAFFKTLTLPLDLRMKGYGCCATGNNMGMIEIVMESKTMADIQTGEAGKWSGAFDKTTVKNFLITHNIKGTYEVARDNFLKTCAGYCVATYVLGVGDRHGDNIMVTVSIIETNIRNIEK